MDLSGGVAELTRVDIPAIVRRADQRYPRILAHLPEDDDAIERITKNLSLLTEVVLEGITLLS